jgi:hypothetical protein
MARVKVFKLPFEINSSQLKSVYEPFGVLQAKVAFYTFNGVTKSRGWAILDFPNEASRQEAERRVTRIDNRYVSYTDVTEHDLQMLKGKVGKKQHQPGVIRLTASSAQEDDDDDDDFGGSVPINNPQRNTANLPSGLGSTAIQGLMQHANLFTDATNVPATINQFSQNNQQVPPASQPSQSSAPKASLKLDSIIEPYFASHKFFIIDVETSLPSDHIHLPVEIAIYAFSFKDGRYKAYHKLIDAGTMPSYYIGSALWKEENVHGIPHSNFSQGDKNYNVIWQEICAFVDLPEQKTFPVNFFAKNPAAKTACLEWIANKAGAQNHFGDVRPVEELIESVCRRKYKDRSFNIGVRNRIPEIFVKLEKIVDGKCEYHRSKDSKSGKSFSCALAKAQAVGSLLKEILDQELILKIMIENGA